MYSWKDVTTKTLAVYDRIASNTIAPESKSESESEYKSKSLVSCFESIVWYSNKKGLLSGMLACTAVVYLSIKSKR